MDLYSNGISYSNYVERKALIKKKIREKIKNNPSFDSFLEEHKAKGKFIKNTTEEVLKCSSVSDDPLKTESIINCKIRNWNLIINAFPWAHTKQGGNYWNSLSKEFVRRNSITF